MYRLNLVVLFIVSIFFFYPRSYVFAATCYCDFVEMFRNPDGSVVYECPAACSGGSTIGAKCDPPEVACNLNYNYDQYVGCCSAGGGGGGPASCRSATVNCPAGGTVSYNQPLYSECMTEWGGSFCSAPGSAQQNHGADNATCCSGWHDATTEQPYDVCDNPLVTTYACCGAGTSEQCQTVPAADVTRSMGWSGDPTVACWGFNGEYYKYSYPSSSCREERIRVGEPDEEVIWVCDYVVVCGRNTLSCSCVSNCTAGTAPTLNTPTNAQIFAGPSGAASVDFSWNAPSSWGVETGSGTRNYSLCVGANASNPCTGGTTTTSTTTSATASVPYGTQYWGVKANNVCGSASVLSEIRNVCVEGYTLPGDAGVGNLYFSQWSACNASTHKRTRTCREDCGTDNCTSAAAAGLLEEDCLGEIRGTIFDATDLSACPSFDPATGYLIGVDTTLTANNRSFVMADQNTTAPHPWSLITPAETNSAGNYSVRVYAPATYTYDFDDLKDMYVVSSGPKLTCTSTNAVVAGSPSNCGTQPCTTVNNMSFGFDRYWSGWWQAVGASVHGENGIKSSIPSSLPTEQSLILGDGAAGNRRGVVSFGQRVSNMLGLNQNAKVSINLWQVLSNYDGVIYDHAYFNQQFKKYSTTVWDGTGTVTYDDAGKGYQIFKVLGSVTDFNYSPTGTQKVIFLISGDVTINSNIAVPSGAFMAVLSGGTINFGTGVTNVDGWYLGDNISIRCVDANADSECDRSDVQFLGNGSFVSWKGTILTRDMGGPANIAGPAEKFTYRMDLYNNAPDPMKIFTKKYKPYVP